MLDLGGLDYDAVVASNKLINDANGPGVAVFVGGTAGLGKLTIKALVSTGISTRIYLVGRKSSAQGSASFIEELKAINSKAEIIWTEGEISKLAEGKRICEEIKSKESRVDLLMLTAGYAPFGKREVTEEGLEITSVLEYYSRQQFTLHLLPLLKASESGRVVSILSGGLERWIDADDINLEKPGNFSAAKAQPQWGVMNTLFMDRLALENPDVTFMHQWPGWVNTGNVKRSSVPGTWSSWFLWLVIEPLLYFFSIKDEVAAQRNLFLCTSSHYGGRGAPFAGEAGINARGKKENGLFLVNFRCKCTPNEASVTRLRELAQQKVWDKTQEV